MRHCRFDDERTVALRFSLQIRAYSPKRAHCPRLEIFSDPIKISTVPEMMMYACPFEESHSERIVAPEE